MYRIIWGKCLHRKIHKSSGGGWQYYWLRSQRDLHWEEHFGWLYRTVDWASMRLHDGYDFIRGEALCKPDQAGHDYRISATINAGDHREIGLSDEVHLPCDVG